MAETRAPKEELVPTVRRAQAGDSAAFAELFKRLHRPVLNYVYRTVGDRQLAEDITQDAFLRAHQRLAQLGPPWDFKSWIFRIAGNLAIDTLRRNRRFVDQEEPQEMGSPPSTQRPAEKQVERREARRQVERTLALLPTTHRQALILRELNALSYAEVSRALECSYDNARQLVHRARLAFRELHGIRLLAESGAARCEALGDLLSAYQDDEIQPDEQKAIRQHLATCEHCQETERDLRRVAGLIAALPPLAPSPGWVEKMLEQLKGNPPGEPGLHTSSGIGAPKGAISKLLLGGLSGALAGAAVLAAGAFALGLWPPEPQPALERAVKATVAAAVQTTPEVPSPEPPLAPPAITATATPSPTPTVTPSPTLGPPHAIALQNSNCRAGPGSIYDVLDYLLEGQESPIHGRDAGTTWWVVARPGGGGDCWIANYLTDERGDLSGVPVVPAPPTPTPADTTPPAATISHFPSAPRRPDDMDVVQFSAFAKDDRGVVRIEIYIRPPGAATTSLVKTCEPATTCIYEGGPYPSGMLEYQAKAYDAAGNIGASPLTSITIYYRIR